jgi:hypothetical protein
MVAQQVLPRRHGGTRSASAAPPAVARQVSVQRRGAWRGRLGLEIPARARLAHLSLTSPFPPLSPSSMAVAATLLPPSLL